MHTFERLGANRVTGQLVSVVLATATIAGCSSPLVGVPEHVQAALDPFVEAGYTCTGPTSDNSAYRQWRCDKQAADATHYSVVLDADESDVQQVTATVDQSLTASTRPEVALDFFVDVTQIDVGGPAKDIKDWVGGHVAQGGQERVGPTLVTLDKLQAVDHLVVFRTS